MSDPYPFKGSVFDDMQQSRYRVKCHVFLEPYTTCKKCGLTKEMCEDGYTCGRVQCNECTLLRQCIGDPPRCEECAKAHITLATSYTIISEEPGETE